MKSIQIYNDKVKEVEKNFDIIDFLQNEEELNRFFYTFKIDIDNSGFLSTFTNLISAFSKTHHKLLINYFLGTINLDRISQGIIKYIYNKKLQLTIKLKEKITVMGNNTAIPSDYIIKNFLSRRKWNPKINILGFGSGEGLYELELKTFLIQSGMIEHANIFSFDPYTKCKKSIIPVTEEEIFSSNDLQFDFIMARWVLHHIPPDKRWNIFIHAINKLKKNGFAIILEHGFIDSNNEIYNGNLYRFFNLFVDIICNIYYLPNWFEDTKPNYGKNFYIDYIYTKDIENIINNTEKKYNYNVVTIGPLFPWQSLITISI